MTNPLLVVSFFVSSRSKWHRSWKTHTQSRWQDCTLNTSPNVTCWKTWGMNTSVSQACANSSHPLQKKTEEYIHRLPDDLKSTDLMCTPRTHGRCHAQKWTKETAYKCGRGGMGEKKRRRSIVIFQFWVKDRGSGKWRRNFLLPSSCSSTVSFFHSFFFSEISFFFVSLHISLFLILAQLCLLVTCVSLAVFPFGFGNGRKPWFLHRLSFSVLTEHWLFMTANSVILCFSASIPVFLSVSHFHTFSTFLKTSLSFLSLSPPSHSRGGCSSCLRTDCFVAVGFWRVNKTQVSLVGERESQFSICNQNVLVLSGSEGWTYMPLGKDLQIGFVILMFERCFIQCFLSMFHEPLMFCNYVWWHILLLKSGAAVWCSD